MSPMSPSNPFTEILPPRCNASSVQPRKESVDLHIGRLQTHIFRRRVRTTEIFSVFDPLRSGRCTREQFARGINIIVLPYTLNELVEPIDPDLLADHFSLPHDQVHEPQVVCWASFARRVDEVFNTAFLESDPMITVPRPGTTVPHPGDFERQFTDDEEYLHSLLARVSTLMRIRGISFDTCFDHVKRQKIDVAAGRILPEAFLRHFPLTSGDPKEAPSVSREELNLIAQRYMDENGMVRLFPLQSDLDDLADQDRRTACPRSFCTGRPLHFRSPKLARNSAGFHLQPPMPPSRPHSASSRRPYKQQTPPVVSRPRPKTAHTIRFDGVARQRPKNEQEWDVLKRIRDQAIARRLRVYQGIRDYDLSRRGRINQCQARAALAGLGIDLLAVSDWDFLFDKFCDQDGFFNYRAFCDIVDPESPEARRETLEDSMPGATPGRARPETARARISAGTPTPQNECGTAATSARKRPLTAHPRLGHHQKCMTQTSEPVRASAVESAMNHQSLPQGGDAVPEVVDDLETEDGVASETADAINRAGLKDILCRLSKHIKTRGMEPFRSFDHFGTRWAKPGHVTLTQFHRAMDSIGVPLREEELRILFLTFAGERGNPNEFNYTKFCSSINLNERFNPGANGKFIKKGQYQKVFRGVAPLTSISMRPLGFNG